MAVDMFLELTGIEGESSDKEHAKKMDVLAFSFGISQSGTMHMGTGGGAGKASFQDLNVTKWVDKASPLLAQHCSTGKHIAKATLISRKAGGKQQAYMTWELENVIVTSYSTGGSGGEDRFSENITLNMQIVGFKYTPQDAKGGKGADIPFKYDIAAQEDQS